MQHLEKSVGINVLTHLFVEQVVVVKMVLLSASNFFQDLHRYTEVITTVALLSA